MLTALAALAAAGVLYLLWTDRRWRREQARWLAERDRIDRYAERLVAANGRPHSGQIVWTARRVDGYDHPEPDELAP